MTNDYKITPAERWDGPHGTGWHQDLAGQGKQAERSRLAKATKIRGEQGYMPTVHVETQQYKPFMIETEQAQRSRSVVGVVGGAVLGGLVGRAIQRRRSQ